MGVCVCVHIYIIGAGGITEAGIALFQSGLTTFSRDERVSAQPPHYRYRHQHLPRDCHVTVRELGTHTLAQLSRCIYVWMYKHIVGGGGSDHKAKQMEEEEVPGHDCPRTANPF